MLAMNSQTVVIDNSYTPDYSFPRLWNAGRESSPAFEFSVDVPLTAVDVLSTYENHHSTVPSFENSNVAFMFDDVSQEEEDSSKSGVEIDLDVTDDNFNVRSNVNLSSESDDICLWNDTNLFSVAANIEIEESDGAFESEIEQKDSCCLQASELSENQSSIFSESLSPLIGLEENELSLAENVSLSEFSEHASLLSDYDENWLDDKNDDNRESNIPYKYVKISRKQTCPLCSKTFMYPKSFSKHMRHHSNTMQNGDVLLDITSKTVRILVTPLELMFGDDCLKTPINVNSLVTLKDNRSEQVLQAHLESSSKSVLLPQEDASLMYTELSDSTKIFSTDDSAIAAVDCNFFSCENEVISQPSTSGCFSDESNTNQPHNLFEVNDAKSSSSLQSSFVLSDILKNQPCVLLERLDDTQVKVLKKSGSNISHTPHLMKNLNENHGNNKIVKRHHTKSKFIKTPCSSKSKKKSHLHKSGSLVKKIRNQVLTKLQTNTFKVSEKTKCKNVPKDKVLPSTNGHYSHYEKLPKSTSNEISSEAETIECENQVHTDAHNFRCAFCCEQFDDCMTFQSHARMCKFKKYDSILKSQSEINVSVKNKRKPRRKNRGCYEVVHFALRKVRNRSRSAKNELKTEANAESSFQDDAEEGSSASASMQKTPRKSNKRRRLSDDQVAVRKSRRKRSHEKDFYFLLQHGRPRAYKGRSNRENGSFIREDSCQQSADEMEQLSEEKLKSPCDVDEFSEVQEISTYHGVSAENESDVSIDSEGNHIKATISSSDDDRASADNSNCCRTESFSMGKSLSGVSSEANVGGCSSCGMEVNTSNIDLNSSHSEEIQLSEDLAVLCKFCSISQKALAKTGANGKIYQNNDANSDIRQEKSFETETVRSALVEKASPNVKLTISKRQRERKRLRNCKNKSSVETTTIKNHPLTRRSKGKLLQSQNNSIFTSPQEDFQKECVNSAETFKLEGNCPFVANKFIFCEETKMCQKEFPINETSETTICQGIMLQRDKIDLCKENPFNKNAQNCYNLRNGQTTQLARIECIETFAIKQLDSRTYDGVQNCKYVYMQRFLSTKSENRLKKPLHCPYCLKYFHIYIAWRNHVAEAHGQNSVPCPFCKEPQMLCNSYLESHLHDHFGKNENHPSVFVRRLIRVVIEQQEVPQLEACGFYLCSFCKTVFGKKKALSEHVQKQNCFNNIKYH